MHQDIERILLDEQEIQTIVARLGQQITEDYRGKELLVVGVLTGGVFFTADLVRAIQLPCTLDFVGVSSYRNTTESGELVMTKDLTLPVAGKDVLVVEDIVDTGRTLRRLMELFQRRGAASVKLCALLDKPAARKTDITADYVGEQVANEFLVGYGLDYAQQYRNLPVIGVLKPEIYDTKP